MTDEPSNAAVTPDHAAEPPGAVATPLGLHGAPEARVAELRNHAALIWSLADSLRGPYKRSEDGHVILPLTLMRRLDQAMENTKDSVVTKAEELEAKSITNVEPVLRTVAGRAF